MRFVEKFMREAYVDGASALQRLRERCVSVDTAADIEQIDTTLKVFADAINILADHDKQAKARRSKIQWLPAGNGIYVAKVGRETYRYRSASNHGFVERHDSEVVGTWAHIGIAGTSVESASRLIRRLKGTKK